ncbi:coat protein P3 [Barley yellow dwarf virus-kerII]|nr:coat protein P3 [Barley yellow dwarf virus-kerII]AGN54062.1 coat protein P3 [Barley yellow dwarf virus-kerII]
MNSVGRRRASKNVRARSNRTVRPVVVVRTNPNGRRRRAPRRPRRGRANPILGPAGRSEVFVFSINDIKANSSGVIKFGPDLSQCPALSSGILKSYHRYKISNVKIEFKSHASSTTVGAMFIELDTACTQSTLGSYINSFTLSKSGTKTFNAQQIAGKEFRETSVNQFYLLFKANGVTSDTAGQFIITLRVSNMTPK